MRPSSSPRNHAGLLLGILWTSNRFSRTPIDLAKSYFQHVHQKVTKNDTALSITKSVKFKPIGHQFQKYYCHDVPIMLLVTE
jgi:hypothetical protein